MTEGKSVVAWGLAGYREVTKKRHEEALGMMDRATILIVVMVLQVHTNVKTYQSERFKICAVYCMYVNYTFIILLKQMYTKNLQIIIHLSVRIF